jgi:hypothetical protein
VGGVCNASGGEEEPYRLLVRKLEGKRPLVRRIRRWINNMKMDLLEIGWGGVDWIGLAACMDLRLFYRSHA